MVDTGLQVELRLNVEQGGLAAVLETCRPLVDDHDVHSVAVETTSPHGGYRGHHVDLRWIVPSEEGHTPHELSILRAARTVFDRVGLPQDWDRWFEINESVGPTVHGLLDPYEERWLIGQAGGGLVFGGSVSPKVLQSAGRAAGGLEPMPIPWLDEDEMIVARLHAHLDTENLNHALQQCLPWIGASTAFAMEVTPAPGGGYDATIMLDAGIGTDDETSMRAAALPVIRRLGMDETAFVIRHERNWIVGALETPRDAGVHAVYVRLAADPLNDQDAFLDPEPEARELVMDEPDLTTKERQEYESLLAELTANLDDGKQGR